MSDFDLTLTEEDLKRLTQMVAEEPRKVLTEEAVLTRLIALHKQANTVSDDIKQLCADAKEDDLPATDLNTAARLIAAYKDTDYIDKTRRIAGIIEDYS